MIKKYSFTVKEEVMAAHNKTLAQLQELLGVLAHYGVVVDYEADRRAENAEYQASIDGLKAQLEAIKEQKLTADEIEIIKAYRVQVLKHDEEKDKVITEYHSTIAKLEDTLTKFKDKLRVLADE